VYTILQVFCIKESDGFIVISKSPDVVFGLFGAGGFGREVIEIANQHFAELFDNGLIVKICFIESEPISSTISTYDVVSEDDFLNLPSAKKYFNIAISNSIVREKIANRFIDKGLEAISISSKNSSLYNNVNKSQGSIICNFCTITSDIKIGKFFHANINSLIAHDCVIGDYVTFAPGVMCLGNVHINDHAYIGAGAILKQGTKDEPLIIGKGAIVGMGAVVTKNVEPFTTVVGIPARIL
jgi:sugar O-acyltransferase (sialic acid O-acetyltransferase NeuD family)